MMFRRRLIGYLALLIAFLIASLGVTPTPQPRPASEGKLTSERSQVFFATGIRQYKVSIVGTVQIPIWCPRDSTTTGLPVLRAT